MKWQGQRRKVKTLSLQASLLAVESRALKRELHDKTIAQLQRPVTLIWAFVAGVFWISNPATKRLGRVQSLLKVASISSSILKLLGIPLPLRPPF